MIDISMSKERKLVFPISMIGLLGDNSIGLHTKPGRRQARQALFLFAKWGHHLIRLGKITFLLRKLLHIVEDGSGSTSSISSSSCSSPNILLCISVSLERNIGEDTSSAVFVVVEPPLLLSSVGAAGVGEVSAILDDQILVVSLEV